MIVEVNIKLDNGLTATTTKKINEELLTYKRERNFNLEHAVTNMIPKVVTEVCKKFDDKK